MTRTERGMKINREAKRLYTEKHRQKLLDLLGPFCGFCGETDKAVLQFDHKIPMMYPPGKRPTNPGVLLKAIENGTESPFNLHVLCANCHMRKTGIERTQALFLRAP